jgi:hypothetical protein
LANVKSGCLFRAHWKLGLSQQVHYTSLRPG